MALGDGDRLTEEGRVERKAERPWPGPCAEGSVGAQPWKGRLACTGRGGSPMSSAPPCHCCWACGHGSQSLPALRGWDHD